MKCKRRFMHGKRLRRSPIKNTDDVDTTFADKVYNKDKVDENLTKSGRHTEGNIRGDKKSEYHETGQGNLMGTNFLV